MSMHKHAYDSTEVIKVRWFKHKGIITAQSLKLNWFTYFVSHLTHTNTNVPL